MSLNEGINGPATSTPSRTPAGRVLRRASTINSHAAIRDVIVANPTLRYADIASLLRVSTWLVYTVAKEFGIRRKKGAGSPAFNKAGKQNAIDELMQARKDAATFDAEEGRRRREDGMGVAAASRKIVLALARDACVKAALAREDRTATADDAQEWLIGQGYSSDYLGNAAGSLFRDQQTWEFTGARAASRRVSNHRHENRIWRLR
jgi:hypothetical protein